MLTVEIRINGQFVLRWSATRITPRSEDLRDNIFYLPNTRCRYRLNNGKEIMHRYGDGAKKLAIKILEQGGAMTLLRRIGLIVSLGVVYAIGGIGIGLMLPWNLILWPFIVIGKWAEGRQFL